MCSAIATDRFLQADIQAVFQEQEGVELRENGTQAVIASILPGEEVILTASAKIPLDFTEEELINTVLVFPEGAEEKGKSDQAAVIVEKEEPGHSVSNNKKLNPPAAAPASGQSATPRVVTATPGMVYSAAGTQADGRGTTYASSPKTGDDSQLLLLTAAAGGAGGVIFLILRYYFRRKKNRVN